MSNQEDWRLREIEIEFQRWGENKGKYEGSITFANGDHESFTFKVRPDMAQKYIDLIAVDIVIAAESLGERLVNSLGLGDTSKEGES